MPRVRPNKLTLLVLLIVLGTLAGLWIYSQIPAWVARYVEQKDPTLQVRGVVELHLLEGWIRVRDVEVKRDRITGTLSSVRVDFDRNIWVEGGQLEVRLESGDPNPGGDGLSGPHLQDVHLDRVTVSKRNTQVQLEQFTLEPDRYCAEAGSFKTQDVPYIKQGKFWGFCIRKDRTSLEMDGLFFPVNLPISIPGVENQQNVELLKVLVELTEPRASALEVNTKNVQAKGVEVFPKASTLDDIDGITVLTRSLTVNHPWLAPTPKDLHAVGVHIKTDRSGELRISPTFPTGGPEGIRLAFNRTEQSLEGVEPCSEWIATLPAPASPAFAGMADHFKGDFRFRVQTHPTPHISFKHNCRYQCSESPIKELKQDRLQYETYRKDGKTIFTRELTRSPDGDWTYLRQLPITIASAFIRMEDPSFLMHRGLLRESLQVAFEQNLEKGRFFRGGSTITQQLAKNLWLKRHKTLGRKIEETFLTIALESCLSKDEILELYLNVVELGPDLYGIGPATRHYFKKEPEELTLDEAYYLASLLPRPKNALPPDRGGIAQARKLMHRLAANGLIPEHLLPLDSERINAIEWDTVY